MCFNVTAYRRCNLSPICDSDCAAGKRHLLCAVICAAPLWRHPSSVWRRGRGACAVCVARVAGGRCPGVARGGSGFSRAEFGWFSMGRGSAVTCTPTTCTCPTDTPDGLGLVTLTTTVAVAQSRNGPTARATPGGVPHDVAQSTHFITPRAHRPGSRVVHAASRRPRLVPRQGAACRASRSRRVVRRPATPCPHPHARQRRTATR